MRNLTIILLTISFTTWGQNCVEKPSDLRNDKILVYLNSISESTKLINDEFERTNDPEKRERRKQDLRKYSHNQYGKPIPYEDTYAIAVEENIVRWMNESITKICGQLKGQNFQVVTEETLGNYKTEDFRYILKYKFIIDNGDLSETKMLFYFHDRQNKADLIKINTFKTFRPFFYYTADKWYPFFGVGRSTKVKKEWLDCLNSI